MVKIYDGEVYTLDIHNYNRMQTLMECWKFMHCEKMHFIVYDNENIIGAMSYQDIVMNREIPKNYLSMSETVFTDARDYFISTDAAEHACIPVVDVGGRLLFVLEYYYNKLYNISENGIIYDNFKAYDLLNSKDSLDYTLFFGKEVAVFWEVEEYTFAITNLLLLEFSNIKIIYLDKNAALFWNEDQVMISDNIYDIQDYISNKSCIYIHSRRFDDDMLVPATIINVYNSISVFKSLIWISKRNCYGSLNKNQTILLIDCHCPTSGLVDIMRFCCAYVRIAKKRNMMPVIKMDSVTNQYVESGENMWESFFEPVSQLSIEEVFESYDVISLRDNNNILTDWEMNPFLKQEEHFLHMQGAEKVFNSWIKINQSTLSYINKNLPEQFFNDKTRILGVIMRGTDYRMSAVKARGEKKERNTSVERVIKRVEELCRIWGYEYIFVATEDEEYLGEFKERFQNRLLYIKQKRVVYNEEKDKNKLVASMLEINGNKEFVKNYLTVLYALSKCHGLLASMYCGATFVARKWNAGMYEVDEVLQD